MKIAMDIGTMEIFQQNPRRKIYIYPSMVNVRALWTIEEVWKLPIESATIEEDTEEIEVLKKYQLMKMKNLLKKRIWIDILI